MLFVSIAGGYFSGLYYQIFIQDLLFILRIVLSTHVSTPLSMSTYATGEKLVNFMVEPKKGTKWPKELPRFSSRPDAIAVCKELCTLQYILRGEKVAKGELEVSSSLSRCCTTYIYLLYCIL